MGAIILRRAAPDDLAAIRILVEHAYEPWVSVIGQRPGPMDDDYAARIAAGQARLAVRGEAILALLVTERHADHLLIDNLAVAPIAQGAGLGRMLLVAAEAEARAAGLARVRLYTHALMLSNIALYTRAGFVEAARITEKGFARVYMEKLLAPEPDSTA